MEMKIEQLREMEKFDTHSHIGVDARNSLPSDVEKYKEIARGKNIKRALLIGVPNPRYKTENGVYAPVNWEVDGMRLKVYSELVRPDGSCIRNSVEANPFLEANQILEKQVGEASSSDLRIHYVPLVHPILDSQGHLEQILERKPVAVKVKGSAWGVDPGDISPEFFRTLSKYDVPAIIHTDYSDNIQNGEHAIIGAQDPLVWLDILQKYNVRASLAHGLRLCPESWKRVSEAGDQFIVGFGPRLNLNGHRIKGKKGGNYVDRLMQMADPKRLTFDMDYAWHEGETSLDEELIGKFSPKLFQDFYTGTAERFYKTKSGGID